MYPGVKIYAGVVLMLLGVEKRNCSLTSKLISNIFDTFRFHRKHLFYASVYLSFYLSIYSYCIVSFYLSIFLSIYLSIPLSNLPSIYLYIYRSYLSRNKHGKSNTMLYTYKVTVWPGQGQVS